jgi:hypothetical protein
VRPFRPTSKAENEDSPSRGKWRYVGRRIRHWKLPELLALGRDVGEVYDDDRVLNDLLGISGPGGVRGEMKNLISATGPKPRIVISNAISNDLEVVENGEHCLFYDRTLSPAGLTWRQLTAWWARSDTLDGEEERTATLHYDPYTRRAGGTLTRQRMDFLLLVDQHRRVVLEVDGIQHRWPAG